MNVELEEYEREISTPQVGYMFGFHKSSSGLEIKVESVEKATTPHLNTTFDEFGVKEEEAAEEGDKQNETKHTLNHLHHNRFNRTTSSVHSRLSNSSNIWVERVKSASLSSFEGDETRNFENSENELAALERFSWIGSAPVQLFAETVGMIGLALTWEKLHKSLSVPSYIWQAIFAFGVLHYVVFAIIYTCKVFFFFEHVKKEWNNKITLNFFGTITISLAMISYLTIEQSHMLGTVLFWMCCVVQLLYSFTVLGRWFIDEGFDADHANPSNFIPIVTSAIIAVPGSELGYEDVSWFYFGFGLMFYFVLFTTIFSRMVYGPPLPSHLVPMLFVFATPPSVGFTAWVGLHGSLGNLGRFLFWNAVVIIILLLRLIPYMWRTIHSGFAMPWWSFTFPLTAFATAMIEYYRYRTSVATKVAVICMVCVATTVTACVYGLWFRAVVRGKVFMKTRRLHTESVTIDKTDYVIDNGVNDIETLDSKPVDL